MAGVPNSAPKFDESKENQQILNDGQPCSLDSEITLQRSDRSLDSIFSDDHSSNPINMDGYGDPHHLDWNPRQDLIDAKEFEEEDDLSLLYLNPSPTARDLDENACDALEDDSNLRALDLEDDDLKDDQDQLALDSITAVSNDNLDAGDYSVPDDDHVGFGSGVLDRLKSDSDDELLDDEAMILAGIYGGGFKIGVLNRLQGDEVVLSEGRLALVLAPNLFDEIPYSNLVLDTDLEGLFDPGGFSRDVLNDPYRQAPDFRSEFSLLRDICVVVTASAISSAPSSLEAYNSKLTNTLDGRQVFDGISHRDINLTSSGVLLNGEPPLRSFIATLVFDPGGSAIFQFNHLQINDNNPSGRILPEFGLSTLLEKLNWDSCELARSIWPELGFALTACKVFAKMPRLITLVNIISRGSWCPCCSSVSNTKVQGIGEEQQHLRFLSVILWQLLCVREESASHSMQVGHPETKHWSSDGSRNINVKERYRVVLGVEIVACKVFEQMSLWIEVCSSNKVFDPGGVVRDCTSIFSKSLPPSTEIHIQVISISMAIPSDRTPAQSSPWTSSASPTLASSSSSPSPTSTPTLALWSSFHLFLVLTTTT